MTQRPVDFAIITVKEEELRAVSSRLPSLAPLPVTNRTYAHCSVRSHHQDFSVVLAKTLGQGPVKAAELTRDLISDLDPYCIVVVGIAGAMPDTDYTLGDVVVATRLHAFTVGAFIEGSDPQFENQGGPMSRVIEDLVALLPAYDDRISGWNDLDQIAVPRPSVRLDIKDFYGSKEWKNRTQEALKVYFGPQPQRSRPAWIARPVASSGFLIKDSRVAKLWLTNARHIAAIEMELEGVYEAARRIDKQYPILGIRGISDIVGHRRDPAWIEYACHSAASFLITLLKQLPDSLFLRQMGLRELLPPPPTIGEDDMDDDEPRFRLVY